jgi:uncharacterized protein
MKSVKSWIDIYPISAFLLLCFTITWSVWFSVPVIAGTDWAFGKIVVGAGFGPALAAIILAQLNGTGCNIATARWWKCFVVVFTLMASLYISILICGDAITAKKFQSAVPVGFTLASSLSVILSSTVTAFIVSCLVCSRDLRLNSILCWRVPLRYWLVALFLPASWMVLGLLSVHLMDSPTPPIGEDITGLSNQLFLIRSLLFTFLVVAIGEEAGWRGWLLPALQKRFSPLMSSFILGLVWGVWHFPLFVIGQYAESPVATFAKMGACVMLATMFTWLYNRASHNLLLAVVLHTAFNNTPRVIPQTEQMALFLMAILASMIIYDRMWQPKPCHNPINY